MKYRGAIASLVAAGGLFGWAVAAGSDVLGMLSFGAAGIGLTLLAPAAKGLLLGGEHSELQHRLENVEARLRLTEAELDTATAEVARLKDERDFDHQLSSARVGDGRSSERNV